MSRRLQQPCPVRLQRTRRFTRAALVSVIVAATVGGTSSAHAQTMLTVTAGPTQYDLSGTGTAPFAAVRVMIPVHPMLSTEPSLGWMSYETQFDRRRHLWFPEGQLVLHPWATRVRPYLGAGAGIALQTGTGGELEGTLAGSLGVLADLDAGWGLRAELRVRAVDPWTGTTADWGLGITRRF